MQLRERYWGIKDALDYYRLDLMVERVEFICFVFILFLWYITETGVTCLVYTQVLGMGIFLWF